MKKIVILLVLFSTYSLVLPAQNRVFTKNGRALFDATAPNSPEKINAVNDKVTSVLDIESGAIQFAVLMNAFIFEKALMQEHFHENYVESTKFPKADFKGQISDIKKIDLSKDQEYKVMVSGKLTLHGVTKTLEVPATLTVKDGQIIAGKSVFKILLSDYNINVPSLVSDKLSPIVSIHLDMKYQPMKSS